MREIDNFCCGCDVCRHCGRNKDVIHYQCDDCGADNIDGETVIYSDNDGFFYCLPCLIRKHMSEFIEYCVDNYAEEWANGNYDKAPESEEY